MFYARPAERVAGTADAERQRREDEAGFVDSGERAEDGDHQQSHTAAVAATTATTTIATAVVAIQRIRRRVVITRTPLL